MAIATDSYIDVISGGITYDRIGLSKTINNYTFNELFENAYCGQYDISRLNNHLSENDVSFTSGNNLWNYSVTYSSNNWSEGGNPANYSDPDGLYGKVIWLQCNSTFDNSVTVSNFNKYKLVTEWDAPKYCADVPFLNAGPCSASLKPANWNIDKPFPAIYYAPGDIILQYNYHLTFPDNVTIGISGIRPYMICKFNNVGFIYKFDMDEGKHYFYGADAAFGFPDVFAVGGITSFDTTYSLAEAMSCDYMSPQLSSYDFSGYPDDSVFPLTLPLGSTGTTNKGMISSDQRYIVKLTTGGSYGGMYAGVEFRSYFTRRHDGLLFFANMGIKFYAGPSGKIYKPIIENSIVVDFSENLDEPSELDNWTGSTAHNVPDSPGGGGGTDEDNKDPVNTQGAPYAKGLVNYYAMTAGSVLIDHISAALSTWDLQNTGKDLYKNLVSCKLIKPPAAIPTTGSEPFTIYGEKPQYEGADITLPVVSGNPDATFGPYSISRKFNDFRDYAPYTRVCIYLPYCGWCDLPSHVVGRSVTVKYFTDIIAATVRAVVFCGDNIVAESAGVMGLDIPFTADAVGMKQAGVLSGLTAYAGGALQTAAGVAQLVTSKDAKGLSNVFSGGSKLLSAYSQTAQAFNENTTEISGKNGDGCSLSGATNIIIKIIRPKYGASSTAPFVPAGFAHSVGFVSNKQVRVGNVSGLLIADNVDTSGIAGATDAERAEIKRVLETGLIVNAAPE